MGLDIVSAIMEPALPGSATQPSQSLLIRIIQCATNSKKLWRQRDESTGRIEALLTGKDKAAFSSGRM
jgi:hypothetical protein